AAFGHGVVRAAMAELELARGAAEREPEQLVTEADPERRHPLRELPRRGHREVERLGIARAVRKHDSLRVVRQHLARRGAGRKHLHPETLGMEPPQDVELDAE